MKVLWIAIATLVLAVPAGPARAQSSAAQATAAPVEADYVARDFKLDINTEQCGDLIGVRPFAQVGEKLLCDAPVLFLAHGLSPCE